MCDYVCLVQTPKHPIIYQFNVDLKVEKNDGILTCVVALASSEFCRSSLSNPTLNGYAARMEAIAAVGLSVSPKSMLWNVRILTGR